MKEERKKERKKGRKEGRKAGNFVSVLFAMSSGGISRGVSGRTRAKDAASTTSHAVPTTALIAMGLVLVLCYVVITAVVIQMR